MRPIATRRRGRLLPVTLRLAKSAAFAAMPPEWPEDLLEDIGHAVTRSRRKVVVLDDDPTGTQTIHDVPVLTDWSIASLLGEMASPAPAFFVLTNSRSLPAGEARALNREIASNLREASARSGRAFAVVSRSDSTLRGHFPAEIEALGEVLGPFDGVLLAPFFATGGRYTIRDVHYLGEGDWLTPVSETEFARDAAFGYRNANLPLWVEEKSAGRIPAADVASLSVEVLRKGGPAKAAEFLQRLGGGRVCVANVASDRDLQVFVRGVLEAEAAGKKFVYRAAASFARVRCGIPRRRLLSSAELGLASGGGLMVVGSFVPNSTEQLHRLVTRRTTANLEMNVRRLLEADSALDEMELAAVALNAALDAGRDTVLYTSRELVAGSDPDESLRISRRVSAALADVLERVTVRPRYILAKGGITSSVILTRALRVRRAVVLGQIVPGVPVWRLEADARWPGMVYVSFPGNLGGPELLNEVAEKLAEPR